MSADTTFHPPRTAAPIDLDAHVRLLPPGASCRGLFFLDPIARLRRAQPAHPLLRAGELGAKRYVPFVHYPYADYMTVLHVAARALYPHEPVGEGIRRLGRCAYAALLDNQVGRVIFGVFGRGFEHVVQMGARGWAVSVTFGRVELEPVGSGHMRYHFADFPAFLETLQVGVVEGAMALCEVEGEVLVKLRDLGNASFDLRWRPRGG